MKNLGLILLVVGILLTIYSTFTFFTKEKVVDIGKVEITRDKKHTVNWSPYVGVALMAAGGLILWKSGKR
ncbi:MAG: hypothetical protein M3Q95_08500 [Bacteroidota bacterium]|nr:hypothetical protein [Bacteroidota bacterium]